jgi:hypothetical protein
VVVVAEGSEVVELVVVVAADVVHLQAAAARGAVVGPLAHLVPVDDGPA